MPGRLSGKVCVITGTGGSMGRAAAMTFAREGASVVGCDLNVGNWREHGSSGGNGIRSVRPERRRGGSDR